MDHDPTTDAADFNCAGATYDGHKGTDFRLLSTLAANENFKILSAAPGKVIGVRDGMPDRIVTDANDSTIANRECGNGVLIDHGNGWQTQYCHMREDSVVVSKGDQVDRGQILGEVGYSGFTQFAHLHFTVRYEGEIVDPFFANSTHSNCVDAQEIPTTLWSANVLDSFPYQRGTLLQSGFSMDAVTPAQLEGGDVPTKPATITAPALVFYARYINLERGDQINIKISGPLGEIVSNQSAPLERNKAHYVVFAGKRRPDGHWPPGNYLGTVELVRDGLSVLQDSQTIRLSQ